MGKKAASKGKAPASATKPAPAAGGAKKGALKSKSTASPATKLAKAKAVPLPRESSPDVVDNAPTASEEEDDDDDEEDQEFNEEEFMKMLKAEGLDLESGDDDEDDEMLDDEEEDSEDDEEDGEESEDVSPEALERMMKLLGDDVSESDIALLKAMKGEGSDDDEDEDEDEEASDDDEEEDEEEVAAALKELEEASDVDADKEDIVPVEKTTTNDKVALERVLASIALPSSTTFFDTLTLVNPTPLNIADPDNDLERELEFYKQSLWAAMHAETLHSTASLPFHRPSDYFAEMVKTDAHMAKLRQSLLDEQAGMKASEDARKLRDAKKFGKKVQQERLREREIEKKRMKEGVEGLKKKRKNGDAFSTNEDFDVALEDALASAPQKKRKPNESERPGRGRNGISRNARDKKYGFGGGENGGRRGKQNNDKEDEKRGRGAFASRGGGRGGRGGGRGGRGGARGGAAKRPGKSRRAQ
ncbi:hypothetical protein JCM11251_005598 [Rhodosporidiobolus azoricus]